MSTQTDGMRRWVWVSAPLAPVFLIGGWFLAQSVQPRSYDAVTDTISALAAHGATDAWIMTVGLAGLGACHVATAAGFRSPGWVARAVLGVGGAATVAVAASPQPSAAHVPAATIAFVALAIWPACMPRTFRRGRWLSLALCAVLIWYAVALAETSLVGLSERIVAGTQACAPLAVVVMTRRCGTERVDRL